jgi:hypothetical protein
MALGKILAVHPTLKCILGFPPSHHKITIPALGGAKQLKPFKPWGVFYCSGSGGEALL